MAFWLVIGGVVISFLGFALAVISMSKSLASDGDITFGGLFKRHLRLMVVMAAGGTMTTIGIFMGIFQLLGL